MLRREMPIRISDDLAVTVARGAVRITPSQGLQLAERLIRASTRVMILEEVAPGRRSPARSVVSKRKSGR